LLGHGWSFDALSARPRATWLDKAAPGRPVALWAHDHHSRWLSSAALRQAGLEKREDPPGGRIDRSRSGAPTGILYEGAAGIVDAYIPETPSDVVEAAISDYARRLAGLGITEVHDPGGVAPDPALRGGPVRYRAMAETGRLPLRVVASVREEQLERAIEIGFRSGRAFGPPGSGRYQDGWLKLFSDGALGSRTAALLSAYDDPGELGARPGGSHGMLLRSRAKLIALGRRAAAVGIAAEIHAIGDAAVRTVLEAIERLPVVEAAAHRIEHAQLIDPADIGRFGRSGIAASVQPSHLISDASAMRRAWGSRTASAFALGALSVDGALIPFGSDAPVESPDPWPGIAAAVYRRGPGTEPVEAFHLEQAITLERALRAACLDAPRSARIGDRGHLGAGAHADLLVLPSLVLDTPGSPDVLGKVRPLATLLDGQVVHRAREFDPASSAVR
jgi:predicted amidohydrolase YtcJ